MQYPMIAQPQYGFAPTMPMMANGGSVADAQSVQSKGRGKDTMLVHMTPKEVGGLQALAMQHGGSLTINPQTGLPEAGFLEAILPTLAGAALTIGSGGVINPYMSAAIVGGIQTARTGDLGQGLLAGLGAYGGAGLGAGLTSAGASAAPSTVAPTAGGLEFATTPADIAAATGGEAAAVAGAPPVMPDPSVFPNATVTTPGGDVTYARAYTGPTAAPSAPVPDASSATFSGAEGVDAATNANFPAGTNVNPTTPSAPTIGENFAQAGQGVKNIFTEPGGFDKFVGEAAVKADPSKGIQAAPATGLGGGFGAAKTAAFAAAPALLATPEYDAPAPKKEEASNYEGPYTPSERRVSYPGDDERRRTSEYTYFTPSNPVPFDAGGKVEEDRSIKMPDASYVAGQAPEFDHNFKAVEVQGGFPSAPISPDVSGISSGLMQLMGSSIKDAAKKIKLTNKFVPWQAISMTPALNGLLNLLALAVCLRWLVVALFPR
jgi:hypothetical protein